LAINVATYCSFFCKALQSTRSWECTHTVTLALKPKWSVLYIYMIARRAICTGFITVHIHYIRKTFLTWGSPTYGKRISSDKSRGPWLCRRGPTAAARVPGAWRRLAIWSWLPRRLNTCGICWPWPPWEPICHDAAGNFRHRPWSIATKMTGTRIVVWGVRTTWREKQYCGQRNDKTVKYFFFFYIIIRRRPPTWTYCIWVNCFFFFLYNLLFFFARMFWWALIGRSHERNVYNDKRQITITRKQKYKLVYTHNGRDEIWLFLDWRTRRVVFTRQ